MFTVTRKTLAGPLAITSLSTVWLSPRVRPCSVSLVAHKTLLTDWTQPRRDVRTAATQPERGRCARAAGAVTDDTQMCVPSCFPQVGDGCSSLEIGFSSSVYKRIKNE